MCNIVCVLGCTSSCHDSQPAPGGFFDGRLFGGGWKRPVPELIARSLHTPLDVEAKIISGCLIEFI